jgi:hypothetical protein
MYIEYTEDHANQLGYPIKKGTRTHVLNDAAKLLISQGIAKAVVDQEDYSPFPVETPQESSSDENETDNKPPLKKKKRPRKTPPPRRLV